MKSKMQSTGPQWLRLLLLRYLLPVLLFGVLLLTLFSITGCSTAPSTIPAKPYPLPEKPVSAMLACKEPILLPEWMAQADLTTEAGLSEWEVQNLITISKNGAAWEECRDRILVLIKYINLLPEP